MTKRVYSALLLLLVACNSGGGGPLASEGGIGGTGISSGPITAFGSFYVTGTEWSVAAGGVVLLDGVSASENELGLGMVVTVEGERSADGLTGTATRVVFDDEIEGPVDVALFQCVLDEVYFSVFGQPFFADRGTVYEDTTFDAFCAGGAGWVVEVSGLPDVHPVIGDAIRATRLERIAAGAVAGVTEVELEGVVQNLNGAGDTFEIGAVSVTINDPDPACGLTDLTDLGGQQLQEGDPVEVEGIFLAANAVCATRIEREDDFEDGEDFEIEGIVTDVTSPTRFVVAGVAVNADNASFSPAGLEVQPGVRLEVEGDLGGGVLVAEEVKQRAGVEIEAVVTGTSSAGFTVLGREIAVEAETEIEDGPVADGSFVEVRAVDDGAGRLTATRVKVQTGAGADRVRVEGRVELVETVPRRLTVAGILIPVDDQTQCLDEGEQPMECSDFFAQVTVGDEVQATDDTGPQFETFDVADELEFED
jgi:hypothetical protein